MYPTEGCAPERPTPFERLAKNSPGTALLVQYAEEVGYLKSENRHVAGEANTLERKLNDSERRELDLNRSNKYYQEENDRLDSWLADSEAKVEKLEKKLKPAKKVAKKAKKVVKK